MKMQQGSRSPFVLCVVVQTVIFGLGNVITKFAYESVTPLWCMVLRFGLALAVFALVFGPRMVRELRGAKLADWVPAAACLAVGYIACNLALDVTTATNVGFLVALPVVFAPFIAQVVRRVRYPRAMIPFQVAVVGGLYLLCCNGGRDALAAFLGGHCRIARVRGEGPREAVCPDDRGDADPRGVRAVARCGARGRARY